MIVRHIFEISDDLRMRITTKSVHDRNDDLALRYVRIYPGVKSRAELATLALALLAPGLLSIGLMCLSIEWELYTCRNSNREQLRKIHQP